MEFLAMIKEIETNDSDNWRDEFKNTPGIAKFIEHPVKKGKYMMVFMSMEGHSLSTTSGVFLDTDHPRKYLFKTKNTTYTIIKAKETASNAVPLN